MSIRSWLLYVPNLIFFAALPEITYAQDVYAQPTPPPIRVTDEFNVNMLAANWDFSQPVKLSSDIDPDLYFQVSTSNGGFTRWSSNLTSYLVGSLVGYESNYSVVIGQRSFTMKTVNGSNVWTDNSATGNTLTRNTTTGIYTFTDRNGVRYLFDSTPFLTQPAGAPQSCVAGTASPSPQVCAVNTSIQYPDGKVINLTYEGTAILLSTGYYQTFARPKYARSSNGISIKFTYASNDATVNLPDWLTVASATLVNDAYEFCNYATNSCSSQYSWPSVTYSHTSIAQPSGQLYRRTTVTDQLGVIHTYDSAIQGFNLILYKNGLGGARALTYLNDQGPNNRDGPNPPSFVDVTDADGIVYQYRYANVSGSTPTGSYYEIHGTRTSSDGRAISFIGNRQLPRSMVITSKTDENNNTTKYTYDTYNRPTEVDYPEGNSTIFSYDARGNVISSTQRAKPGSGLADLTQTALFPGSCSAPAACNKPASVTDARNNVTSYTWDQITGNMLSATQPPDANGAAPAKRFSYTPMSAWVSNGSGGYVAAGPQRSMLTEMRTCKSTATVGNGCSGGSADEIVTTYYYGPQTGPNNLQLRGQSVTADGTTLVTCYGYDRLGRKISETKPRANVQVCP